jgi:hypothetical protein
MVGGNSEVREYTEPTGMIPFRMMLRASEIHGNTCVPALQRVNSE